MERIHSSSIAGKKQRQRRKFKKIRCELTALKKRRASNFAIEVLPHFSPIKHACTIGSYFDVDGEFPTEKINQLLIQSGKKVSFPAISDYQAGKMHFVQWRKHSRLRLNRYQIPEIYPDNSRSRTQTLDLLLVPLLAYDKTGNRLGMGGGFYDRFAASHSGSRKPFLLGIGFTAQRANNLATEPWDYALDAILTESGIQRFHR